MKKANIDEYTAYDKFILDKIKVGAEELGESIYQQLYKNPIRKLDRRYTFEIAREVAKEKVKYIKVVA